MGSPQTTANGGAQTHDVEAWTQNLTNSWRRLRRDKDDGDSARQRRRRFGHGCHGRPGHERTGRTGRPHRARASRWMLGHARPRAAAAVRRAGRASCTPRATTTAPGHHAHCARARRGTASRARLHQGGETRGGRVPHAMAARRATASGTASRGAPRLRQGSAREPRRALGIGRARGEGWGRAGPGTPRPRSERAGEPRRAPGPGRARGEGRSRAGPGTLRPRSERVGEPRRVPGPGRTRGEGRGRVGPGTLRPRSEHAGEPRRGGPHREPRRDAGRWVGGPPRRLAADPIRQGRAGRVPQRHRATTARKGGGCRVREIGRGRAEPA
jgi:hypothetical protein|eukprot:XP_020404678.1 uncharacterized protein LOC109944355 [Zea mays]